MPISYLHLKPYWLSVGDKMFIPALWRLKVHVVVENAADVANLDDKNLLTGSTDNLRILAELAEKLAGEVCAPAPHHHENTMPLLVTGLTYL